MPRGKSIRAGRAFVEIFADDSRLDRGLNRAQQRLENFGRAAFAVGASVAAAMGLATAKFASFGDQLDKMSARTGIAVESLSELKFAAEQNGASLDELGAAVLRMNRRLGRITAGQGTSAQVEAMNALGLSAERLERLNPEQRLFAIADAMAAMADPAEAAGLAQRAFGTQVDRILPLLLQGSDGMKQYMAEARALGLTLTDVQRQAAAEFTDEMNRMQQAAGEVAVEVGDSLVPVLRPFLQDLKNLAIRTANWIEENEHVVQNLAMIAGGLLAVGGSALVLSQVIRLVNGVRKAVLAAASAQAFLSALAGPKAWLVIAGAVGVATGAVLAYQSATADVADAAERAEQNAGDLAKTDMDGLADQLNTGANGAGRMADNLDRSAKSAKSLADAIRGGEFGDAFNLEEGRAFEALQNFASGRFLDDPAKRLETVLNAISQVSDQGIFQSGNVVLGADFVRREAINELTGAFDKIRSLRDEIALLQGTTSRAQLELRDLAEKGVPEDLLNRIRKLIELREKLEQKEEREQKRQRERQEGLREIRRIEDSLKSPQEKLIERLREIQRLQNEFVEFTRAEAAQASQLEIRDELQRVQRKIEQASEAQRRAVPVLEATDVRSREGFRRILQATGGLRSAKDSPEVKELKAQKEHLENMLASLDQIEKNTGRKFVKK